MAKGNLSLTTNDSLGFIREEQDPKLGEHKANPVLDHPNGSVTDVKIGSRTINNPNTDSGNTAGVITTLLNSIVTAIRAVRAAITAHTGDMVRHITAAERSGWNSKISMADLKINEPGGVPILDDEGRIMPEQYWKTGGDTWVKYEAIDGEWQSVCYGAGLFVAVSENKAMTSPDGINWTERTVPAGNWRSVCCVSDYFVAVGYNSAMTSPDGINWTERTMLTGNWISVAYIGGGVFAAVAIDSANTVALALEGANWAPYSAPGAYWMSICYGNNLCVAVCYDIMHNVMTSPDGVNWTMRTAIDGEWQSVCYGAGLFVAVGENKAMTSPDGINWTERTVPAGNWTAVTYGGDMFTAVASGSEKAVAVSPDGIDWTAKEAPQGSWSSVCYGNDAMAAVGYNAVMMLNTLIPPAYADEFSSHVSNEDMHITAAERMDWNEAKTTAAAAQTAALYAQMDVAAHASDSVRHITAAERERLSRVPDDVGVLLDGKVDKETGKGLSANDYTDADKIKVSEIDAEIADIWEAIHEKPTTDLENAFDFNGKSYSGLFLQWDGSDYVFKPGECGDYLMHSDGVDIFIHPIGVMIDEATNKRYKNIVRDGVQILQEVV